MGFLHGGFCAIGSASGALLVFDLADDTSDAKPLVCHLKDAHKGFPIHVLCEADGLQPAGAPAPALLSCGKDGVVKGWLWDAASRTLSPMGNLHDELALDAALPSIRGAGGGARLRAMDYSSTHGLLVGSNASELLLVRRDAAECRVLVHGHAQRVVAPPAGDAPTGGAAGRHAEDADETAQLGALRCLAVPLHRALCVSAGDDATLRLWGLRDRMLLAARGCASAVTALGFDATTEASTRLAIGYEDGGWEVLPLELPLGGAELPAPDCLAVAPLHLEPAGGESAAQRRITDVRFAPNGRSDCF